MVRTRAPTMEGRMPVKKLTPTKCQVRRASQNKAEDRITIENVNVPGYTTRVDAGMYRAMCRAMLRVLPSIA